MKKTQLRDMIIQEMQQQLNEREDEELVDHYAAEIFDSIIAFKKVFQKTPWKKNRNINKLIRALLKLDEKLGDEISNLG